MLLIHVGAALSPVYGQTTDKPADGPAEGASAPVNAQAPAASAALVARLPAPMAPAPLPLAPSTLTGGPDWVQLTPAQKQVLSPLQTDWNQLDSAQKSKWLEVAARFHTITPDEQTRIHQRMTDWARLSPTQRQQARVAFQTTQRLQVHDIEAKWDAYQSLPPERRAELAAKAAQKAAAHKQPHPHANGLPPQGLTKNNLVPISKPQAIVAIAPSILQARPGATTILITQGAVQPIHQPAGLPKVLADPNLVDGKTLLPKRNAAALTP
ncbi:MAG: DUF3106 domain-containing protein [Burkholderiaceae bacterium]|nr:DUF3106 domain-containing protein [Roseateles sp.]MBV8470674.1 DUF3106 domain-containing protein [Burkholderiaceae bacterium]